MTTSGPWEVRERKMDGERTFIASAMVENVACCRNPDDAPLIAAAPDLLDAAILGAASIRLLLQQVPRGFPPSLRNEFEKHLAIIDAAVAKTAP